MLTPGTVWEWIRPSLEELKQHYNADPEKPWEELRDTFLGRLGLRDARQNPVVEELLERLHEAPEEERNRILGSDELDSMTYELVLKHAAGQETAGDGGAGYDQAAWHAYLTQNGPQWGGTEESWKPFQQWFAYYATQCGLGTPATALLTYLNSQSAAQRIATFAEYGVTITPPWGAAGDGVAGYDEAARHADLAQNGPQ